MTVSHFKLFTLVICLAGIAISVEVVAQGSSFAKIQFGDNIYIEVPINWTYLNDNIRQHINTASEATIKLKGLPIAKNKNLILLAANTYTSYKTLSASVRLSIRYGPGGTQAEVIELAKVPKAKQDLMFKPVLDTTVRVLRSTNGVKNVKAIDARVESNRYISCIFTEFEYTKPSGVTMSQTWLCPMGNKAVKLSTSYRKAEATLFKPVIRYIFESLSAK